MSSKNFKVKNGIAIQGTTSDTVITGDNNGGLVVGGSPAAFVPSVSNATTFTLSGQVDRDENIGPKLYFTNLSNADVDNLSAIPVGSTVSFTGNNYGTGVDTLTIVTTDIYSGGGSINCTFTNDSPAMFRVTTGAEVSIAGESTAGKVLKSTGTGVEWGNIGSDYKEVFFLAEGSQGKQKWSVDGITWVETGYLSLPPNWTSPAHGVASSNSTTVIVAHESINSSNTNQVLSVWENLYSETSGSQVMSMTGAQINSAYQGIGTDPIIEGIASNGTGTFVISFLRSLNVLVSTDFGSTWSLVAIPAPPTGEGEGGGGEGGQNPYWNYPTYQFGKFYITAFGNDGYIESSDGLNWTAVSVSGIAFSMFQQVYVDASGSILAGYDQAMGLIYNTTANNQSYFGVAYNTELMNVSNTKTIKVIGGSLYFEYAGSLWATSIKYLNNGSRRIYSYSQLDTQSLNFATSTSSAGLFGGYNFATNQHRIGQVGKNGASWPAAAGLFGQSDMWGTTNNLFVPISVYNKYAGE